jgi:hypothetical protein
MIRPDGISERTPATPVSAGPGMLILLIPSEIL